VKSKRVVYYSVPWRSVIFVYTHSCCYVLAYIIAAKAESGGLLKAEVEILS